MSSLIQYRYAVADCKNTLKMLTKDSEVSSETMIFWIRTCENYIRQRTLRVMATGSYLSEYYGINAIPVQTDNIKKWITIPSIYDLDFEKGIDYISYNLPKTPFSKQVRFTQTDAGIIDQLWYSPYEAPEPSNPYFYRVGNNIFLLGIEGVSVVNVNVGLYSALDPRPIFLSPDAYLQIDDEQYPSLKNMVLNLGKFVLIVPSSRDEVGADQRNEQIENFAKSTQKEKESPE